MTGDRIVPLSTALAKLMNAEREVAPLEGVRLERIRAGVEHAIGGPGGGGGGSGGGGGGGAHQMSRDVAQAAAGASGLGGYFAVAAAALVVGATIGALGYRALAGVAATPSVPPLTTAPSRVAVEARDPAPELDPSPSGAERDDLAGGESLRITRRPTGASARAHDDARLEPAVALTASPIAIADEQRTLDAARGAIGRGHFEEALAAVARHDLRFPDGQLAEEREVIAVQALALSGRHVEARARAARFFTTYPGSLLAQAVERALAAGSAR